MIRLACVPAVMALGSVTMACPPEESAAAEAAAQARRAAHAEAYAHLVAQHSMREEPTESVSMSQTTADGQKVIVVIEDGQVKSATLNGKGVPPNRVTMKDEDVIVLGVDGKEIARLKGMASRGAKRSGQVFGGQGLQSSRAPSAAPSGKAMTWTMTEPSTPPKVMMGVILDGVSGPLAEHFGLTDEDATLLTAVDTDLPAGKAGLKAYDIIVAIDGKTPCPVGTFREVMSGKNPGDTVTLSVISKGVKRDVTVTLEKYDGARLKAKLPMPAMAPEAPEPPEPPEAPGAADGSVKQLLRERLRGMEGLQGLRGQLFEGPEGNNLLVLPEQQRELDKKLGKMAERLEKLEEMLRRLIEEKTKQP